MTSKEVKVTMTKKVVLQKTDTFLVPEEYTEEQVLNHVMDKLYNNGKDWKQIKISNFNIETE